MTQPESRIVRRIKAYIDHRGGRAFKIVGSELQEAGIPDILACYRGEFIGIEVKQPGGKPSRLQKYVLNSIDKSGGYTLVADNVSDVAALMDRIDRRHGK